MAAGDKIQATQISSNSSSWYQRLRNIQKNNKTGIGGTALAQSSDPGITAGTKITATQINNFITELNNLKTNVFLKNANWSQYQPSAVTSGISASAANIQAKIDNMLTSLERICSNCQTYSTNTYDNSNSVNSTASNKTYSESIDKYDYAYTCKTTKNNYSNSTYTDDNVVCKTNSTNNYNNSNNTYGNNSKCNTYDTYNYQNGNSTDSYSPADYSENSTNSKNSYCSDCDTNGTYENYSGNNTYSQNTKYADHWDGTIFQTYNEFDDDGDYVYDGRNDVCTTYAYNPVLDPSGDSNSTYINCQTQSYDTYTKCTDADYGYESKYNSTRSGYETDSYNNTTNENATYTTNGVNSTYTNNSTSCKTNSTNTISTQNSTYTDTVGNTTYTNSNSTYINKYDGYSTNTVNPSNSTYTNNSTTKSYSTFTVVT